jgi:hypothetical protein
MTSLSVENALELVSRVAANKTPMRIGARLAVVEKKGNTIRFVLTSLRNDPVSDFTAETHHHKSGTALRIGGLDNYRTFQTAFLGFIPVGPKNIGGMALYKKFLHDVSDELRAVDPHAKINIGIPNKSE